MGKGLFEIIDELLDLPRLDPGPVEKATGVELAPLGVGDGSFTIYLGCGEPPSELGGVELRHPGSGSKAEGGLLILNVSPELYVPVMAIRARFGFEESFDPSPADAPGGAPSYTGYHLGGARISFGFVDPDDGAPGVYPSRLACVIIDRTGR